MNHPMHLTPRSPFLAALFLLAAACGTPEPTRAERLAALDHDACEHLANGPSRAVTASAEAASAPTVFDVEHTRFDVTLADLGGNPAGVVKFTVPEAGEYVFHGVSALTLALQNASGAAVPFVETKVGVSDCSTASRWIADLAVGTHLLTVTSGDTAPVQLMLQHLESPEHDDHGHDH